MKKKRRYQLLPQEAPPGGGYLPLLIHGLSLLLYFFDPAGWGLSWLPEYPLNQFLLLFPAALPGILVLSFPPLWGLLTALFVLLFQGAVLFAGISRILSIWFNPLMAILLWLFSFAGALTLWAMQYRLRRIMMKLLDRSYRDPESGLPNRYKLMSDIERYHSPALALFKAERFNEINSCFGAAFGSEYLTRIRQVIDATLSQTLGGVSLYHVERDTFAILEEYSRFDGNPQEVQSRFATIIGLLREQTFSINGLRFPVPVTAGIALGENSSPEILYSQAEQALIAAVFGGKSDLLFEDSVQFKEDIISRTGALAMVSHAISEDRLTVVYQPIVRNRGALVEIYEALVRIIDEKGDLVPPGKFLDSVKLSSYMKELTRQVFEISFRKMDGESVLFTVNISMENIYDPDFLPFLESIMKRFPNCKDRVILEITESEGVENYNDVKHFIDSAKELGYLIAIDDFGSGYSNFLHILRLPIQYIKFDGAIVQEMKREPKAAGVVQKMNEMAHDLGIKTIAEFVDSKELLDTLKKMKIDYSQGFLLGKPSQRLQRKISC